MDRFNVFVASKILHIKSQDFSYGMQVHNSHKTGIVRILPRTRYAVTSRCHSSSRKGGSGTNENSSLIIESSNLAS